MEFKYKDAPKLTKSMKIVPDDLGLTHIWVVYPGKEKYKIANNITVLPLIDIPIQWVYDSY